ncbi:MAG: hypothetical protein ABI789_08930 [Usitatibacter sp.]
MKRTTLVATIAGAILVSATALGISAAVDSPRSLMSPVDYGASKRAIETEAHAAVAKCGDLDRQAKDMCRAEAKADERIRKADLEALYRGTVAAAADAKLARAKAQYEIARAKCGDQHGEDRISCMRIARAAKAKAGEKLASR